MNSNVYDRIEMMMNEHVSPTFSAQSVGGGVFNRLDTASNNISLILWQYESILFIYVYNTYPDYQLAIRSQFNLK